MPLHLPCHHACDPLTRGACGVDGRERLVAPRAPSVVVCAQRRDDLRMPPCCGSEDQAAALVLDTAPRVPGESPTIRQQHTGASRGGLGHKRLGRGRVGGQDHRGGGITPPSHRGMACNGRRRDPCAASRPYLAQAVVEGTGAPILPDKRATRGTGASRGTAAHLARQGPDEPRGHGAGHIGTVGRGHVGIEGLVSDGGAPSGMEAAGEIGPRLDGRAGTGGRQRQAQAPRRADALAATTLLRCTTGVEPRCGQHPWALVSNHAQVSVVHLARLSWSLQPYAQEEFRRDRNKNQQQKQILKSTYL
jgi:hypothetical protein